METMKGVISGMSKDGKRFKIDDAWYSVFALPSLNGAKVGDTVKFAYIQKESGGQIYNNVRGTVTVMSGGDGPASAPAATSGGGRAFGGESPERNMSIIRQNALTNAVNYYNALKTQAKARSPMEDELIEIITVAETFVKFSSGEYERAKAEMEAVERDTVGLEIDEAMRPAMPATKPYFAR